MAFTGKTKVFADPVHGHIELDELLVTIIDTRVFQRLRHLKQLGGTSLVYPAAVHNRFEHCIGVCHLAGQMMESLERNSEPALLGRNWAVHKRCVQVAALCHDLGHGPFSHLWETVMHCFGKAGYEHEETSSNLIERLYQEKKDLFNKFEIWDEQVRLIKDLVRGGTDQADVPDFLYEIVANKRNDVDVDKWDYFLRDGQLLKINITFDFERLLRFCKVVRLDDGSTTIAFRDKMKNEIQDMFRMRGELHRAAYQHKIVKTVELMIVDAMVAANQAGYKVDYKDEKGEIVSVALSDVNEDLEAFVRITDHIVLAIQYSPYYPEASAILDRISRRKLYSVVGCRTLLAKLRVEDERWKKLERKLRDGGYGCTPLTITTGKHQKPWERVCYYDKNGRIVKSSEINVRSNVILNYPSYQLLVVFKKAEHERDHKLEEALERFIDDFNSQHCQETVQS